MKKDNSVYLHHILDAISRIETYIQGVTKETFLETGLLQDAVVRQLEIIGEASRNITDDFRGMHAEVPWSLIIGLRNRIVHAYFNVNFEIAWTIAQNDLPSLKRHIEKMLDEI